MGSTGAKRRAVAPSERRSSRSAAAGGSRHIWEEKPPFSMSSWREGLSSTEDEQLEREGGGAEMVFGTGDDAGR